MLYTLYATAIEYARIENTQLLNAKGKSSILYGSVCPTPLSDAQTAHALAPDILDAPQADLAQANKCVNAYRYWLTTSVREV